MSNRSYKQYFILAGLLSLFILPFGAAWLVYHSPQVHQLSKKNQGELLPPIPLYQLNSQNWQDSHTQNKLHTAPLRGKWGILLITYPPCHHTSPEASPIVEKIEQRWRALDKIKISLGKDQSRLTLIQAFPGLNNPLGAQEGELYVFDPLGNILLHYTPDQTNRAIRQDIKQLLHASQIG